MKKKEKKQTHIILSIGKTGSGLVFGRVTDLPVGGEPVEIHDVLMIIYFSAACGGLLGLAADGPKEGTRLTRTAKRSMCKVWQEWVEVEPEVAEKIYAWPHIGE